MDTQDQQQSSPSEDISNANDGPSREELNYPEDRPGSDEAQPQEQDAAPSQDKQPTPQPEPAKPQDGEYQLTMPEGIEVDQALLEQAIPTFRDAGISVDQANKLVPLVQEVQASLLKQQMDGFRTTRSDWAREAKADNEIGGENWKETSRLANIALTAGGAEAAKHEARELFNESGLGNHPAILRLFRRMGAEIERLRSQKGIPVIKESAIDAARRHHQESVYPNDKPRSDSALRSHLRAKAALSPTRVDRAYPNDPTK